MGCTLSVVRWSNAEPAQLFAVPDALFCWSRHASTAVGYGVWPSWCVTSSTGCQCSNASLSNSAPWHTRASMVSHPSTSNGRGPPLHQYRRVAALRSAASCRLFIPVTRLSIVGLLLLLLLLLLLPVLPVADPRSPPGGNFEGLHRIIRKKALWSDSV